MILEELITEFHSLSDDDAMRLIMSIRANRRVSKRPVATKTADKKPKQTSLDINSISPQMATLLLQKLRGGA